MARKRTTAIKFSDEAVRPRVEIKNWPEETPAQKS
jgi:hypothetical protein